MNLQLQEPSELPAQKNATNGQASALCLSGMAVVGLGYWGPNWVRVINQMHYSERIVCCDFSRQRLGSIRQLHPSVEITDHLGTVLSDPEIEAVVVATPVSTHYEIARDCLMAGKSVLVEKPLAMSSRHAADLVRLARRQGRILMVGHTFEYSSPVLKAVELIESGELGDVFYISSVRANLGLFQKDINVAWDLATHDISIILMMLGRMPVKVSCQGESHYRSQVEDIALITLHFSDHVVAFIHVSWLDPTKIRRATVVGSKKMLVYDDTALQEKIRIYDKGVTVQPHYNTFGDFQMSYRYGDIHIPRIEEPEPLKLECEDFVTCIKGGGVPRSDGLSGYRVVSILEAAELSLRTGGQPVEPKPLELD